MGKGIWEKGWAKTKKRRGVSSEGKKKGKPVSNSGERETPTAEGEGKEIIIYQEELSGSDLAKGKEEKPLSPLEGGGRRDSSENLTHQGKWRDQGGQ